MTLALLAYNLARLGDLGTFDSGDVLCRNSVSPHLRTSLNLLHWSVPREMFKCCNRAPSYHGFVFRVEEGVYLGSRWKNEDDGRFSLLLKGAPRFFLWPLESSWLVSTSYGF